MERDLVARNVDQWRELHDKAMRYPNRTEKPIVRLYEAINLYLEATDWDGEWFLDQYVASLLEGFRGLLNGPIGRLDAGTLDGWVCDAMYEVHFNPDTSERIDS